MHLANQRWFYIVTSSLIGWVHTKKVPEIVYYTPYNMQMVLLCCVLVIMIFYVIFKHIFVIDILSISCEVTLSWIWQNILINEIISQNLVQ